MTPLPFSSVLPGFYLGMTGAETEDVIDKTINGDGWLCSGLMLAICTDICIVSAMGLSLDSIQCKSPNQAFLTFWCSQNKAQLSRGKARMKGSKLVRLLILLRSERRSD